MEKKADRDQIRRQNRGIILAALRRSQSIARVDLGRETKLSPATVTSITSDLIDEKLIIQLVEPDLKQAGSRGRPRTFLTLNPDAARIAGIKISVNKIELLLADYQGNILGSEQFSIRTDTASSEHFAGQLVELLKSFCRSRGTDPKQLVEIGVASQGVVNSRQGTIVWSPAFSEPDIQITKPIQDALGIHCSLSNDSNMIAQALHWKEPDRFSGTFIVIFVDYGVGCGLYIDNELFTGDTGAASEIGHANHIPGGNLCRCGKLGCLEAYLGDYALMRSALNLDGQHSPGDVRVTREEIRAIADKARSGDAELAEVFRKAGEALGYGIARLLATLDPSRVAITGAGAQEFDLMESGMQSALNDALVEDLRQHAQIEVRPWQEDIILAGTIARTLQRLDSIVFAAARNRAKVTEKEGV
ncbi:MAG: ROK family protein [Stappiaceae bacterium]